MLSPEVGPLNLLSKRLRQKKTDLTYRALFNKSINNCCRRYPSRPIPGNWVGVNEAI